MTGIFDDSVVEAVQEIVSRHNEGKLSDKEYPLALLNAYGMMMASQMKRQADALVEISGKLDDVNGGMDAVKYIHGVIDVLKELRNVNSSGVEGLSHIFETLVQIEMNSRK